jgi:uncharacterized NAD(P)/FAD-binding protein YdhS
MQSLVASLDALGVDLREDTLRPLLAGAALTWDDVAPFVVRPGRTYARRRVVRRAGYELLVLTWAPGQSSAPHDHAGSLCGLVSVRGTLTERRFVARADGTVEPADEPADRLPEGRTCVDPGVCIHALNNPADARSDLVTVHVYAPPIAELRRYVQRQGEVPAVYAATPAPGARTVAIVGGGFSGTMTAAHLLRQAHRDGVALHVELFDDHPALGQGVAYRTPDDRHLLNVPAAKMSAWPDQPDDFLQFARGEMPDAGPGDFLPRSLFGRYVRHTFDRAVAACTGGRVTLAVRRQNVRAIRGRADGRLDVSAGERSAAVDAVVLAIGHRPPDDPVGERWHGPRTRWIGDPWSSLALSTVEPHEPVLLLGTGLTAVDVVLSLGGARRTAPVTALSRHGLLPAGHARGAVAPADLAAALESFRAAPKLTTAALLRAVRAAADRAADLGHDWRGVIDALRPHTAGLWRRLDAGERLRFMKHVRPFWEIHRHRVAPPVAAELEAARAAGRLTTLAGRIERVVADDDGATVHWRPRGGRDSGEARVCRVAWVVNCTGPGAHARSRTHPLVAQMCDQRLLTPDELGLGVLTAEDGDDAGLAISAGGRVDPRLAVVGTLRKAALWESTAVPELRQQAAAAAAVLTRRVRA